jgi:phosphoenolpyruvate-protein phosphotransferase
MPDDVKSASEQIKAASGEIRILSPEGFHARPAANLVKTAKKFASEIKLIKGDRTQNAKSLVGVMGFALQQGDTVALEATGPDAKEAIAALVPIISGSPKTSAAPPKETAPKAVAPPKPAEAPKKPAAPPADGVYSGLTASPGVAAGVVRLLSRREIGVEEKPSGTPEAEKAALEAALEKARCQITAIEETAKKNMDAQHAAIFGAHLEMLDDPELTGEAFRLIKEGKSAAFAWKTSYKDQAKNFAAIANELFAARAADLEDVGGRVLRALAGVSEETGYGRDAIIVAEELTPSDTASLGKNIQGFVTVKGGATSHIAILARSLGIPALVGADETVTKIPDGTPAILNAGEGKLATNPRPEEIERVRARADEIARVRETDLKNAASPAVTKDGVTVEVAANIGGTDDAIQAVANGCDGVGLLRSEFLFLGRETAPGEEEQAEAYVAIARALGPERRLVVRTMDIGGDKPLPYIDQEHEDNPFLGVRGLRLSLKKRELFDAQLRAILKAAGLCKLHVMFPMVSTLEEFREAKEILRGHIKDAGSPDVKIGLMIEVPAAAILARHFAKEADFMSLGTNDLTQYTMAADRGNPHLANIADGFNPAVLAMIKSAADGAKGRDCWVGVCGGLAGETLAVPALIGLGVQELSASGPSVPQIKARVRTLSKADCEDAAARVLDMAAAAEVKDYLGRRFG